MLGFQAGKGLGYGGICQYLLSVAPRLSCPGGPFPTFPHPGIPPSLP